MNVESELLWPGVALLLLLGTVASLCVRCSRPGKGTWRGQGWGPQPGLRSRGGQTSLTRQGGGPEPPMKTVGLAHCGALVLLGLGNVLEKWRLGGCCAACCIHLVQALLS